MSLFFSEGTFESCLLLNHQCFNVCLYYELSSHFPLFGLLHHYTYPRALCFASFVLGFAFRTALIFSVLFKHCSTDRQKKICPIPLHPNYQPELDGYKIQERIHTFTLFVAPCKFEPQYLNFKTETL